MPDFIFPFPDRDLALQELCYDTCCNRIDSSELPKLAERAWRKGSEAARSVWMQYGGEKDFFKIIKQCELSCRRADTDYIVGNRRYFSDYISGQNQITLYLQSIALWAQENHLSQSQAENLILSHEFFHYLEWNKIGLTSKLYEVPLFRIGRLKIEKTGIRALSEIGAHAFARTYYEMTKKDEIGNEREFNL